MLCINNDSIKHQSFVYTQLNDQTVLLQTIQFSISHLFALSLNSKEFYLTLLGVIPLGQSRLRSDGNEGVLDIPQSSSIIGASSSYCLMSSPGHSLGESYPSAEMQLVYYTAPDHWALTFWYFWEFSLENYGFSSQLRKLW